MIEELCIVCGHIESVHRPKTVDCSWTSEYTHWCEECSINQKYTPPTMFHNFKIDNLRLIEDLAKERKLV
jgi:hypothetical protein